MSILIKKKTSMAGVALLSLSALALFIGISCVTLEEVNAAPQNKPAAKKEKTTTIVTKETPSATKKADTQEEEMIPINSVEKVYGQDDEVPSSVVDVKPKFLGGDEIQFSKWVFGELQYPADARKDRLQGRVILRFVVNEKGYVRDVKVIKGVTPSLDREALRVIAMSPRWTPGSKNGKNVKVTYVFPVIFKLK